MWPTDRSEARSELLGTPASIDVPFRYDPTHVSFAHFRPRMIDGTIASYDILVETPHGGTWTSPGSCHGLVARVGTVDLGRGDEIFFKHMYGNTQEWWYYSLIDPRRRALVELVFTFGHREGLVDMEVSKNFYDPAFAEDRAFLGDRACDDGYPDEAEMTAHTDQLDKAASAWKTVNPAPKTGPYQFIPFPGAFPGRAHRSISEGGTTYSIFGDMLGISPRFRRPVSMVTSTDRSSGDHRILYAASPVGREPGSGAATILLKRGRLLAIGTRWAWVLFLNLETGRMRWIKALPDKLPLAEGHWPDIRDLQVQGPDLLVNGSTRIAFPDL